MRVFMLGWEFPPFISGGLGTACYGLTKALSQQQVQVTFVLPKAIGSNESMHVRLLSPQAGRSPGPAAAGGRAGGTRAAAGVRSAAATRTEDARAGGPAGLAEEDPFANVTFRAIPSRLRDPYQSPRGRAEEAASERADEEESDGAEAAAEAHAGTHPETAARPLSILAGHGAAGAPGLGSPGAHYEGDLIAETQRYARLCVALAKAEEFDVIHAHDWMTYPAGLAVAAATGRPLVVHVHSTEFDRAGDQPHNQVYEIERRGMQGAMRVIAVSHLTRKIIERRYGIDPEKIDVVYNGIDKGRTASEQVGQRANIQKGDKIVLFLGRVTMQKGPEYFVNAAKKVLEKYEKVKFVIAGTGDKVRDIIELAAEQGIGQKVLFTGFLRGADVERVFRMADVYVMPSVSEPFGIAPLEAIRHDVPVIISKTSGVAEVLTHALKVDFWDTHEIANKIIAVLRHPPLSSTLRQHAEIEVRRLTWDDAARKCQRVYRRSEQLLGGRRPLAAAR